MILFLLTPWLVGGVTYALSAKSKAEAYSSGGFGGGGFSSGGGGGGSFGGGGGGGGFR